jgi:hypothetical protein
MFLPGATVGKAVEDRLMPVQMNPQGQPAQAVVLHGNLWRELLD